MYRLEKFYSPDFNPQQYWSERYAQAHTAGKSSLEFRKQGFWTLLQKYLEKGKRYLDAGCGVGGWILFLNEEGYSVEGIDTAARVVRALTEYNPDLKVKVASLTAVPYADASLDGVLAIGALEYLENNVPTALREVQRVLKPGGVFFLEVPLANSLRRFLYFPLKQLERLIKTNQGQHPTFANYQFTPDELKNLLQAAGFSIAETQPHELPEADQHYGLYVDWPFLRGKSPYELNGLGKFIKNVANSISPWIASTGIVIVAKKS